VCIHIVQYNQYRKRGPCLSSGGHGQVGCLAPQPFKFWPHDLSDQLVESLGSSKTLVISTLVYHGNSWGRARGYLAAARAICHPHSHHHASTATLKGVPVCTLLAAWRHTAQNMQEMTMLICTVPCKLYASVIGKKPVQRSVRNTIWRHLLYIPYIFCNSTF
jgi:hypothetical protein